MPPKGKGAAKESKDAPKQPAQSSGIGGTLQNAAGNAAGSAGGAAKDAAMGQAQDALMGAATDQADAFMKENGVSDIKEMVEGGDVMGTAMKVGGSAATNIAKDAANRAVQAGGSVVAVGEKAIEKGMKGIENILDAEQLAALMKDMGDWAQKHPKLAVLGIPKLVLGVPGLFLFALLTTLIFIISLVLALVLALVVSLLILIGFILLTLLVIFPMFFIILFIGIFGLFWGLLFYFMVVKKLKKKYSHIIPDKNTFSMPDTPSKEPIFKVGKTHKLPKKKPTPAKPAQQTGKKTAKDFPNVPKNEPGKAASASGSQPKPFKQGKKNMPKKRPAAKKEAPMKAE